MKAAIMRRHKLGSTRRLADHLRTHDLERLAKELKLSPREYGGIKSCRRQRRREGDRARVPAQAVHEAWRYGARLDGEDEKAFVAGLNSVIEWCGREIR